MRIGFMGTPDFAVATLDALVQAGYEIVVAVTQPDKPQGRSDKLIPPPVKTYALEHNIPVFQPERVRTPESIETLRTYGADIFVVAAFGQILPSELLYMPELGSVCVHASLLPKYRGAAPINRCIIDGEKTTGITIMKMNEGIDTGDIYYAREIPIEDTDTAGTLFDKLAKLGGECIVTALPYIEQKTCIAIPQDESKASYAKMLKKELGHVNFSMTAAQVDCLIRGVNPWPVAYTNFRGKNLKIWEAHKAEGNGPAGTIAFVGKEELGIFCGEGTIVLTEVQLEGKKRMPVRDFLLGNKPEVGESL